MIYQNPQLLYALIAIAIPILVHLLNFRKHKSIYFSSVRFLKNIKEESRKKSELKNILVLLSRILAIIFLVLAFAKPYIPKESNMKTNNIFLYIDNSKSMDIDFGNGNLLNIAKKKAIDISQSYQSEKKFYIVTNDFEAKNTANYSSDVIKFQIEKIKSSPKQRSISDIISRINSINPNNHLYVISDFQKNTLQISGLEESNTNNQISLIPIKNKKLKNIRIDTLYSLEPVFNSENEVEIHVGITNTSNEDINDEVLFLYLDNKQKSQQYIDLLSQESKKIIFKFFTNEKKIISAEIRTQDSHITFDNNLFFTIIKSKNINITEISNKTEHSPFKLLFKNDTSLFNFTSSSAENINYNELSNQDFIILNEIIELTSGLINTLQSFTNNGGNLLIVPPKDLTNFSNYNYLLKSLDVNTITKKIENKLKINRFSTKHQIYQNVFTGSIEKINYPTINQTYLINNNRMSTQIIGLANKQDFLSLYSSGKGNIYQFSAPLNYSYSNFSEHALFVPTLINMATSSILTNIPYYIIGSNKEISINNNKPTNNIINIKGDNIDIIPTVSSREGKHFLNTENQITKNGIYSITTDNQLISKVAFNYNPEESLISAYKIGELENFIKTNKLKHTKIIKTNNSTLKEVIKQQEIGKEYWRVALILSLLFFTLEILLIKLIKL